MPSQIIRELHAAILDGSAQVWTEHGRVDCNITIVGKFIELDVDVEDNAVTIGWGHGPFDLVEIEHIKGHVWRPRGENVE